MKAQPPSRLAPGGRIALAGISGVGSGDWLVARLRSNGKLDKSFSGDGATVTNPGGTGDSLSGIGVDGNKIVVGGETNSHRHPPVRNRPLPGRRWGWTRASPAMGSRASASGTAQSPKARATSRLQGNGRIVAAGFTFDGSSGDQALVRLLP